MNRAKLTDPMRRVLEVLESGGTEADAWDVHPDRASTISAQAFVRTMAALHRHGLVKAGAITARGKDVLRVGWMDRETAPRTHQDRKQAGWNKVEGRSHGI